MERKVTVHGLDGPYEVDWQTFLLMCEGARGGEQECPVTIDGVTKTIKEWTTPSQGDGHGGGS